MRTPLALAAALASWVGAHALQSVALEERATWPAVEEYVMLPSPESAPILSAGYRELFADITWVRMLVYYGSSRVGEADFRYLNQFIDNVIALDPKFERLYRWAAYAVTFKDERATQEEFRLSVKYLERGIKEFPDDYELYWILGLRYWLDLETESGEEKRAFRERGAELIEEAMRKPGAPPRLATLAASLRTKLGQNERARRELMQMILTTHNKKAQKAMLKRLEDISEDSQDAEEARRVAEEFERLWNETLPNGPAELFIILGPRPSPVVDFDELATERDLFGAEGDEIQLFPR